MDQPDTLRPRMAFAPEISARIAASFAPLALPDQPVHLLRRGGHVALLHRHNLRLRFLDAADFAAQGPARAIAPLLGAWDAAPPPRPAPERKVLQAVITSRCNLRCGYCTVFHLPQPALERDMDAATLARCLAWLEGMPPEKGLLILHGGEPLLAWETTRWLAERSPVHTVLFTNGLHLDAEKAAVLARLGVNVLVSLDGPPEVHDALRRTVGGQGSYAAGVRGLRQAQEAGCETGISLVIGPHNAAGLTEHVPWLLDTLAPASLGLNLPHYTRAYPRCTLDLDQVIGALQALLGLAMDRRLFLYPLAKFLRPLVQQRFKHHDCSALGEKIVVFPDGSRSNCISHTANALGPQDLDVWNDLLPTRHALCRACPALGICGGGCLYDALHFSDGCAYDLRYCTLARRMLEFLVWDVHDRVGLELPTPADLVPAYAPMGGRLPGRPAGLDLGIGHETDA